MVAAGGGNSQIKVVGVLIDITQANVLVGAVIVLSLYILIAMDLRFSKDDIQKQRIITHLLSQEGLNQKSSELGLGSVNVVSYSQKSPTGTLKNFLESIITNQQEIARNKAIS